MHSKKGEQPETILIRRAKAGDRDAFNSLYQIYLNAIYRYIYFRIAHIKDAQDLTEQVFLNAWDALPAYQDRGHPFSSWLYRIAHLIVGNYHREKQKNQITDQASSINQARDQVSILKQIIKTQDTETLARAISQLPHDQQQVIVLRFIEGLNHGEVSQLMARSQSACRILQSRALTALNQLLN
ncbi:MAG: sigma-70 family RNA polymerase sigma factor [Anaerolineales bacterium]|nr:sigma-70 family RNA polymerase sigma factor [Anaerolineales bacterium]